MDEGSGYCGCGNEIEIFFHFYVTRAFSIPTISTIRLCVLSWTELSEALVSGHRGVSDPSLSPIRNILFLFLFVRNE